MARRRQRKNANGLVQDQMSAVRADLNALGKDMRELVSNVGGAARREVRGAMDGTVDRVGAWANQNLAGVRDAVRSQPLKACALSIGAGAIIGALLLR